MLYDEDCGFCTAVAERLARRDGVVAELIGGAAGDAALAKMGRDERYASFHVVDGSSRVSSASDALAVLLAALPAGHATGRLTRKFPRATDALYRQTARHRKLLGRLFRVNARRVDRSADQT